MRKLKKLIINLHLVLMVILLGCQQTGSQKESLTEEVEEVEVSTKNTPALSLTAQDSVFIESLIKDLKGIDKFFVTTSYKRLQALLEKIDDQNAARVNEILSKVSINEPDYYFEKYMPRNGYLAYTPGPVEVYIEMVYWNTSDGSQLIATQSQECGPVCDMEISFKKYKNGTYEKEEAVIPDQIMLSEKLVPGSTTDDSEPYEFYFKFPIVGKDLQYCIGEECLILKWTDGVFVLED